MSEEKKEFEATITSIRYLAGELKLQVEGEVPQQYESGDKVAIAESLRRNGEPVEWRCFHCDEVFVDSEAAALHFGTSLSQKSVCTMEAPHLREMEARLNRYQEEDTDLHREMHKARVDHHAALQRAEEAGYSRGLRDAAPQPLPSGKFHAALLWLLWHHQGGSSEVGQPIRKMLGIGRFDHLTEEQLAEAKSHKQ